MRSTMKTRTSHPRLATTSLEVCASGTVLPCYVGDGEYVCHHLGNRETCEPACVRRQLRHSAYTTSAKSLGVRAKWMSMIMSIL
eukprot:3326683-Amphidinium_carterae.1